MEDWSGWCERLVRLGEKKGGGGGGEVREINWSGWEKGVVRDKLVRLGKRGWGGGGGVADKLVRL